MFVILWRMALLVGSLIKESLSIRVVIQGMCLVFREWKTFVYLLRMNKYMLVCKIAVYGVRLVLGCYQCHRW